MEISSLVKSEQIKFANKYDRVRAEQYYDRFQKSYRKRLLNWLEQRMLSKGIQKLGSVHNILDIPAGTGRFWQTLKTAKAQNYYVADYNVSMLEVGFERRSSLLTRDLVPAVASAFALPFPDNSIDVIVSMRFIHHISVADDRALLLNEWARVSRNYVLVSSWVDETGFRAESRLKKQKRRQPGKDYNKFVHSHGELAAEFKAAGFEIVDTIDHIPQISPWRLYVLRKEGELTMRQPLHYSCPRCHQALVAEADKWACHQDKLAYPIKANIPLLTARDAYSLSESEDVLKG